MVVCLLWSLVEVQSQTEYPYISFRGTTLSNHSYVDLSQVGDDRSGSDSDTVQCHTDLVTCCRRQLNGIPGRGDWFAPGNETRLPFRHENGEEPDIHEDRQNMVVHIRRRNNTMSHLVYIAVLFQLMLSIMIVTHRLERQSMWDCMPGEKVLRY